MTLLEALLDSTTISKLSIRDYEDHDFHGSVVGANTTVEYEGYIKINKNIIRFEDHVLLTDISDEFFSKSKSEIKNEIDGALKIYILDNI